MGVLEEVEREDARCKKKKKETARTAGNDRSKRNCMVAQSVMSDGRFIRWKRITKLRVVSYGHDVGPGIIPFYGNVEEN